MSEFDKLYDHLDNIEYPTYLIEALDDDSGIITTRNPSGEEHLFLRTRILLNGEAVWEKPEMKVGDTLRFIPWKKA